MSETTDRHATTWEDGGIAATVCIKGGVTHEGPILHDYDTEPVPCYHCGKLLRLKWNVTIEELPAP